MLRCARGRKGESNDLSPSRNLLESIVNDFESLAEAKSNEEEGFSVPGSHVSSVYLRFITSVAAAVSAP